MATTCLNCGTELTGKYCQQCGQKATVERLTWHSLLHEIFHFFTHIERGFIKTTKGLLIRPGFVNKSYIEGKRRDYHKPISFLLIWIAIYLLLGGLVDKLGHYKAEEIETFAGMDKDVVAMIRKYRSVVELLILPFTCLNAWLIIARPKLNFVEVMATGFYGFSVLFIFLATQNFMGLVLRINPDTKLMINSFVIGFTIWNLYAAYDLYSRFHVRWLIPRIIISTIIGFFVYLFLSISIAKLFIAWGF